MFWKNFDYVNFYGFKMFRLVFCGEILISMKKIDLFFFWDVLKWIFVKFILKFLITKFLAVIFFIDLKFIGMISI